jgi:hypothetical protein
MMIIMTILMNNSNNNIENKIKRCLPKVFFSQASFRKYILGLIKGQQINQSESTWKNIYQTSRNNSKGLKFNPFHKSTIYRIFMWSKVFDQFTSFYLHKLLSQKQ